MVAKDDRMEWSRMYQCVIVRESANKLLSLIDYGMLA